LTICLVAERYEDNLLYAFDLFAVGTKRSNNYSCPTQTEIRKPSEAFYKKEDKDPTGELNQL